MIQAQRFEERTKKEEEGVITRVQYFLPNFFLRATKTFDVVAVAVEAVAGAATAATVAIVAIAVDVAAAVVAPHSLQPGLPSASRLVRYLSGIAVEPKTKTARVEKAWPCRPIRPSKSWLQSESKVGAVKSLQVALPD